MSSQALRAGVQTMLERLQQAPYPTPNFRLLPHQEPPDFSDHSWDTWLLMAGRGTGKTLAAAIALNRLCTKHRSFQARIIAPTVRDARECVLGATGLKVVNPNVQWRINEASVFWPNGSRVRLYGAFTPEDVERLRAGGNSAFDWYEEFAAWPRLEEVYDQASFGLRLGPHPRTFITTTPKPVTRLRRIIEHPRTRVTRARTTDNPHLADTVKERLFDAYGGTRLGRQELEGELLDEIEGAYWKPQLVDESRLWELPGPLLRAVVAVDPAKTGDAKADETGLIVAGRDDSHGYILEDLSGHLTPREWAQLALDRYRRWGCDALVVETNVAGDMTAEVIRAFDPDARLKPTRSQQAKGGRALPAVALYEQGRIHHVGRFDGLENQMFAFTGELRGRDDRVDALVLALRELNLTRPLPQESRGWRVIR